MTHNVALTPEAAQPWPRDPARKFSETGVFAALVEATARPALPEKSEPETPPPATPAPAPISEPPLRIRQVDAPLRESPLDSAPDSPTLPPAVRSIMRRLAALPADWSQATLVLDLSPPHLGRVRLELARRGRRLALRVGARSPEARAALQDAAVCLREAIAAAGLELDATILETEAPAPAPEPSMTWA